MPIYVFTCQSCGLRFEKLYRRVSYDREHPCTECDGIGTRQVTAASFSFKHPQSQLNGALPPNTGTSDDFNFDKAIGRDAEKKWSKIHENNARKDTIIRDEANQGRGITRDHLVKKREGGYRVIEDSERKVVNERREAAFKVSQAATEQAKDKK